MEFNVITQLTAYLKYNSAIIYNIVTIVYKIDILSNSLLGLGQVSRQKCGK